MRECWNAEMLKCTRAKRQRCKIANALSCTIGLGNDRPATRGECGTGMYKIGKAS